MALSIKNQQAEALARELAKTTGEGITEAVTVALQERLARVRGRRKVDADAAAVRDLVQHFRRLPDVDPRSLRTIADDLYDDDGLPR